ncbi:beta-1,6-N-acetylglucosaminyltransferase [Bacteroides acidifaciens]|nr:beta-1,6-N-acetylglucosaminyltransferase [Bacteroides acidifaciens]
MLRHAFLITAHKEPDLLIDLVRLLSAENHYIIVNIDKKSELRGGVEPTIGKCCNQVIFTYYNVSHGGYSQISTTIKLLKLASELDVDYCHLISGQDFPCKSMAEFDCFFEVHNGESYMWFDSEEQHEIWSKVKYPSRVDRLYFNDIPFQEHYYVKLVVFYLNRLFSRFKFRSKIPNLRAGWNWFSWNKKVVSFVLNKYKDDISFFNRFKYTNCCDEIVFHTLLYPHLEQLKIHKDNSLRYINWTKMSENGILPNAPLVLTEKDLNDIDNHEVFFCRKVDTTISRSLLKILSQRVMPGFKSIMDGV